MNIMKIKSNLKLYLVFILFNITILYAGKQAKDNIFNGKWCVGEEKLVINFTGKDSIAVYSKKNPSIKGVGTYIKNDSNFTVTLINEDSLVLKMIYKYKIRNKSLIKAKIISFTVDDESADKYPQQWMRMERCNPDTLSVKE